MSSGRSRSRPGASAVSPRRRGVRAGWYHLAGLVLAVVVAIHLASVLAPALSTATVSLAIALSCLVCYAPLRLLARREDMVAPLWWDLFYFATVAAFLWSALAGDPAGMLVTGAPTVALNVLLCVAVWLIEHRHPVRIYTTGRRYTFVPRHNGATAP